MFIEDGTGSGKKVGVSGHNRLQTSAITRSELEILNADDGAVWSLPIQAAAASGATVFFVFQNNGQTTYAVSRISLSSSVAGLFKTSKATGTPAGGSVIVPVPMNIGIVSVLDNCTVQQGASITGLTDGGVLSILYYQANIMQPVWDFPARIVMPPGTTLMMTAPGATTISGVVEIFKKSEV